VVRSRMVKKRRKRDAAREEVEDFGHEGWRTSGIERPE
jgi:hypothetical protein